MARHQGAQVPSVEEIAAERIDRMERVTVLGTDAHDRTPHAPAGSLGTRIEVRRDGAYRVDVHPTEDEQLDAICLELEMLRKTCFEASVEAVPVMPASLG